ncbi:hypothetical protein A3Q56_01893 [Intoshia linei]|uniref:Uncharacterized protein n=1 Tax=Intoshia linei TaxID=1819745 RepID=A0A177B9N8_9BILA|nr:hypothetical protein A3Q56_01893 [Intoshia linei]
MIPEKQNYETEVHAAFESLKEILQKTRKGTAKKIYETIYECTYNKEKHTCLLNGQVSNILYKNLYLRKDKSESMDNLLKKDIEIKNLQENFTQSKSEYKKLLINYKKVLNSNQILLETINKIKSNVENNNKTIVSTVDLNLKKMNKIDKKCMLILKKFDFYNDDLKNNMTNYQTDLTTYKDTFKSLEKSFNEIELKDTDSKLKIKNKKNNLLNDIKCCNLNDLELREIRSKIIIEYIQIMYTLFENFFKSPINEDDIKGKLQYEFYKYIDKLIPLNSEIFAIYNHKSNMKLKVNEIDKLNETDTETKIKKTTLSALSEKKIQSNLFLVNDSEFSTYAAIMEITRNNGISYEPIGTNEFCDYCHEITFICPHKIQSQVILKIPPHTTHAKITRPIVYINQIRANKKRKPVKVKTVDNVLDGIVEKKVYVDSVLVSLVNLIGKSNEILIMTENELNFIIVNFTSYFNIFEWSHLKFKCQQIVPLEFLQKFLIKLFSFESVVSIVMHSFLNQLIDQVTNNFYTPLNLILNYFAGINSIFALRYILILNEILNHLSISCLPEVENFVKKMYPYLIKDDIDMFKLDYMSFSKGIVNKDTLLGFLVYSVSKGTEPRLKEAMTIIRANNKVIHFIETNKLIFILSSIDIDMHLPNVSTIDAIEQMMVSIHTVRDHNIDSIVKIQFATEVHAYMSLLNYIYKIKLFQNLKQSSKEFGLSFIVCHSLSHLNFFYSDDD